jgi:pimeloyl-ACP methyl ester carboxylesterase
MICRYSRNCFSTTSKGSIRKIDHFVEHKSQHKIFAREWKPPVATNANSVPLILLHDSLGCVDLWREFPELLCANSGRRVIAYDRLGFGLSDARQEVMPLSFIEDEAKIFLPSILDHFQINQFIVFGHSVGGGMAVQCISTC